MKMICKLNCNSYIHFKANYTVGFDFEKKCFESTERYIHKILISSEVEASKLIFHKEVQQ